MDPEIYDQSNEGFYEDDNGTRSDADFHEELLGEVEDTESEEARAAAIAGGMSEDIAAVLYQ